MTAIDEIIKREVNPFDLINLKPGNFWGEHQDSELMVESIHQQEIAEIEGLVDLVAKDHRSRSMLLLGDSGSGKSYLLGRLKSTLNPKAFFAYIGPWVDSDYIWRHILRYTVDSLIQIPEGQQESQLILWLKSLSAFTKRSLKQRIFNDGIWQLLQSDRQKFIKHLKDTYDEQAGIYNPDIFFGVLHDLTDPELYPLACEWLRGDDLSEESMQALKVKHCVDTEDAAKNILANFGKISTETQPIILCFDNLDNIPNLPDGFQDFQALFNVNTTIHNDHLKNFIIIISIITNTWKRNADRIQQADKARIDRAVRLKLITLDQAEALWAYRLKPLHHEANSQPTSPIYPLNRQVLEQNFPGGKTLPRNAFILGRQEYHEYKLSLLNTQKTDSIEFVINTPSKQSPTANSKKIIIPITKKADSPQPRIIPRPQPTRSERIKAEFELLWQQEYQKVQGKNTKITLLPGSDLIQMLQEVLAALEVQEIKTKLISGKYANNSLSYQQPGKRERIGVVWTEESHMNTFFNIMNACKTAIQQNLCQTLYLIRAGNLGNQQNVGNQLYKQIFTFTNHRHIKPDLSSVHYLATYHSFVNSALAYELVLAGKTITLQELQTLTRDCNILQKCTLLQDFKIVSQTGGGNDNGNGKHDLQLVKNLMFNLVKTQSFIGLPTLIKETKAKFSSVSESEIQHLIQELCQEQKVEYFDPKAKPQDQLVCLVPNK
ncbi:MAG: ATP-binding protein [Tolypothrix carrinoi HA7290-LM1]|jgi:hypothetical protein|nr:ATP-binding protein [Tolypothrix carrinoi HA7290-LM1]